MAEKVAAIRPDGRDAVGKRRQTSLLVWQSNQARLPTEVTPGISGGANPVRVKVEQEMTVGAHQTLDRSEHQPAPAWVG